MSTSPKLSVVMPVYNAQQFLAEAIDSILQQTLADFEFIIIDDCSTDGSLALIQSYRDPRIRLYQNPQNLGITPTLNRGVKLATSDLIARMDADDVSHPDRLQQQYDYLQRHPDCALLSTWVRVIAEDGAVVEDAVFDSEYYYYNLTFICWMYHSTVVFRKQAVQQVGGYTVPYAEDFELFWQPSRRYVIGNLPAILLDYRVTTQSLHQVLKQQEYRQAHQAQVLRNIRYYTGNELTLTDNQLQCLQHNFAPLLAEANVGSIVECLRKLESISERIFTTPNVNLDGCTVEAAFYKRDFILSFYVQHLPTRQAAWLLLRLGLFRRLIERVFHI